MTLATRVWDSSHTATSIAASSINNGADAETAAISQLTAFQTEVTVAVTYGGTATQGVDVHVLRNVDGTTYEAVTDDTFVAQMPYATSALRSFVFTVPGEVSQFKVLLSNDAGAAVTATVKFKQLASISSE